MRVKLRLEYHSTRFVQTRISHPELNFVPKVNLRIHLARNYATSDRMVGSKSSWYHGKCWNLLNLMVRRELFDDALSLITSSFKTFDRRRCVQTVQRKETHLNQSSSTSYLDHSFIKVSSPLFPSILPTCPMPDVSLPCSITSLAVQNKFALPYFDKKKNFLPRYKIWKSSIGKMWSAK